MVHRTNLNHQNPRRPSLVPAHIPDQTARMSASLCINNSSRLRMSMLFRHPQQGISVPVIKVTNRQLRQGWLRGRGEEEIETSGESLISTEMAESGLMDCAISLIYVGHVALHAGVLAWSTARTKLVWITSLTMAPLILDMAVHIAPATVACTAA